MLQAASPRRRRRQALRWAERSAQWHFYSLKTQPCSPLDQWHGFQEGLQPLPGPAEVLQTARRVEPAQVGNRVCKAQG